MSKYQSIRRILYFLTAIPFLLLLACFFAVKKDISLESLKNKYTNTESQFILFQGMPVHYRDEGSGELIVLLHGTGASIHTWDDWVNGLKNDYRVIRMDLPAFGLTGPHPERDYSIQSYAHFVSSFLDQLEVDSFALVGNSLGGRIAWYVAASNPGRVSKLALIDASGFPMPKTKLFQMAQKPLTSFLIKKITPRNLVKKNLEEVYFDDAMVDDALVDRYWEMARRTGNRQAFIDRARTQFEDDTALLTKITCPTLVMWGNQDQWIPVSHAHKFKRMIPQSKLAIIENAGHVPMEERPAESLALFREFMQTENQ
jgi:pimeloyl-ACP methyl ester carboxylesterase